MQKKKKNAASVSQGKRRDARKGYQNANASLKILFHSHDADLELSRCLAKDLCRLARLPPNRNVRQDLEKFLHNRDEGYTDTPFANMERAWLSFDFPFPLSQIAQAPTTVRVPPWDWLPNLPDYDYPTNIGTSKERKADAKLQLLGKRYSEERINQISPGTIVYSTDGSAENGFAGGAWRKFVKTQTDLQLIQGPIHVPLGWPSDSHEAEAAALSAAIQNAIDDGHRKVHFVTDSKNCNDRLRRTGHSINEDPESLAIVERIHALRTERVQVDSTWVPSHCDFWLNELLDGDAKDAMALGEWEPDGATRIKERAKDKRRIPSIPNCESNDRQRTHSCNDRQMAQAQHNRTTQEKRQAPAPLVGQIRDHRIQQTEP